ncbi:MltA domain-containing protein [Phenylobacterium sp.]|uniref:MltA domain-containing protein n=1 Tax=Phenylobacterium sp. TaxID=1871053 RepID=UPI003562C4BB
MQSRAVGAAFAALILAACAATPPSYPIAHSPARRPPPSPFPTEPRAPSTPVERSAPLTALKGWEAEDHAAALAAFRETCGAARDPAMAQVCRSARAIGPLDRDRSRRFFEANFRAEAAPGDGVLTAYFAPEYPARHKKTEEFSAPLRARPADLKTVDAGMFDPAQTGRSGAARDNGDGTLAPYPDRTAIEATPPGHALAWLRPEDLFFLQIQGSGVLTFEGGRRMKALYAANNGRAFVAVSNIMRDRGLLAGDNTSAEAIRSWLADHRGPDAEAIMRLNPRYAFFSLAPDDGRQPVGSANLPLPPGRALAVDPAYHQMGELYWVDAETPILKGAFPSYRRLALALDTGGAIKGEVRADLYLGLGAAAGAEAGRVRHTLRLYRLVPKDGPR